MIRTTAAGGVVTECVATSVRSSERGSVTNACIMYLYIHTVQNIAAEEHKLHPWNTNCSSLLCVKLWN